MRIKSSWKQWLIAVVAVFAGTALLAAAAESAQAHCTAYHPHHCIEELLPPVEPILPDPHPLFGPNCGSQGLEHIIPDKWGVPGAMADFTPACIEHDKCYDDQLGQLFCDDQFRRHLYRRCQYGFPGIFAPLKATCNALAEGYYRAVRSSGQDAYRKAGAGSAPQAAQDYDRIYLKNRCDRRIQAAISYKSLDDSWQTEGWWTLEPGESVYAADTRNINFYTYAESIGPVDQRLFWSGDDIWEPVRGSSAEYGFRKQVITTKAWGSWTEGFTCD